MDPVVVAVVVGVVALVFIFFMLNNRKGGKSRDEAGCGRIACEPIVPVEDRDEEGVGPDERKVDGDIKVHHQKKEEAECDAPK